MTDKDKPTCPDCGSIASGFERSTVALELRKCRDCGRKFAITKPEAK